MKIDSEIDFSKMFIPEWMTPLAHTPIYSTLTSKQRIRYNQLYALYFNEITTFFESFAEDLLLTSLIAKNKFSENFNENLLRIVREERGHTAMFQALNKHAAPELYKNTDYYFLEVNKFFNAIGRWASKRADVFPLFFWLINMQEERSTHHARSSIKNASNLESNFVQAQRRHLQDEVDHVKNNQQLLKLIWYNQPKYKRIINARLFSFLVGTFFNLPKRSSMPIFRQLALDCDGIDVLIPEMMKQIKSLHSKKSFHQYIYSRKITPKTFENFDKNPEFHHMDSILLGYEVKYEV